MTRFPRWNLHEDSVCSCPRCQALEAHTRAMAAGLPPRVISTVRVPTRRVMVARVLEALGDMLALAVVFAAIGLLVYLVGWRP